MSRSNETREDYNYPMPGNEPDRLEEARGQDVPRDDLTVEPWEEGDNTRGLQHGSWDYEEGHTVANPRDEEVRYGGDEQPTDPPEPPDS
ncbi:MAG: hypothetical protein ACJ78Q_06735 [Chloroflexia bacterium]